MARCHGESAATDIVAASFSAFSASVAIAFIAVAAAVSFCALSNPQLLLLLLQLLASQARPESGDEKRKVRAHQ